MPIYEYQCADCGHQFEEMQKFSEPPLEQCPSCQGKGVQKKVSKSAFHLKGGGWYKDGYGVVPPASSDTSGKESGSETKATETTDAKPEQSKSPEAKTETPKTEAKAEAPKKTEAKVVSEKNTDSKSRQSSETKTTP